MVVVASIVARLWNDLLASHERQGLFLVLVGFIGSFGFIRMSARLMRSPRVPWWPGSVVSESGVHLHHLVWGICLMIAAGTLGFTLWHSPWWEICAGIFGIGVGLAIDEFALWIHLEDVYWAEQGRSSIDAMVIAAAGMCLVLVGARPFEVSTAGPARIVSGVALAIAVLAAVLACFAKQRLYHGAIGFFVFPLAFYGAFRLGKPGSYWARRFYGPRRPDRQARAEARFAPDRRTERLKNLARDALGGTTAEVYLGKLAPGTQPPDPSSRHDPPPS
jgi:hypothetical protein